MQFHHLRWFAPPKFPNDEEKNRRASMLNVILTLVLVYLLLMAVANWVGGGANRLNLVRVDAAAFALLGVLLFLLRHGQVEWVGIGSLVLAHVTVTLASIAHGTIRTPATGGFLFMVILAASLYDWRGVLLSVSASSLTVLGLIAAEDAGWLPQPDYAVSTVEWISYTSLFAITAGVTFFTNRLIHAALTKAKSVIAEREQAEAALRDSERNFRTFFETITDLVIVAALDGRILYTNSALSEKLGYNKEDLSHLRVLDLNPADRRAEAEAIFADMLRGELDMCPLPVVSKAGGQMPAETRVWLGRWNDQDCIFGIIKDLSVEMEAQQRFERMFRNNPAMMAITSLPERRYTDVNNAFLRATGYSRAEVIGKTATELNLVVQPERIRDAADRIRTDGHVTAIEAQVRCKDGTLLDGLFWGELIHSQGRDYFLTLMIDVTERNRLQEELRQSEANLRRAQRVAHIGSYMINLQTGEAHWSEELPLLFGIPEDQFTYQMVLSCIHPEDRAIIERHKHLLAAESSSQFEMEYRLARPDGEVRYVRDVGEVSRDAQGQPTVVFAALQDITERKRAEEDLRHWAHIFEYAEWGVTVTTPDTNRIMMANPAYARMHGFTVEELIGQPIFELFAPEERDDVLANNLLAHEKGHHTWESIRVRKDGTRFPGWNDITVVRDASGKIQYRVVNVQDITEHKQAEEELRKSEALYRSLFELTNDGITLYDLNGTIISANPRSVQMMGFSAPNQMIGHSVLEFTAPDQLEDARRRLELLRAGQTLPPYERTLCAADGSRVETELSLSLICDNSGRPLFVQSVVRDITERKMAEEKLRESEAIYRALFEVTNDGILLYDMSFNILRANQRSAQIVGLASSDALVGRCIFDFMPLDQVEDARRQVERLCLGQGVPPYDRTLYYKDGSMIETELSLSLIRNRDGRPLYVQSVIRDITQRKRHEEALRKVNDDLVRYVAEVEKLQAELREQSLHDPLTGLYNRRFLDEILAREMLRSDRSQTPLSVLICDIDHFKSINDAYGHQVGDKFLLRISDLLTGLTRGSDFVCRYGGEEFLIVMPGTGPQDASQRANEIRQKCAEITLKEGGNEAALSMSIGVAAYPIHGCEAEEVITKADKAMYESKRAGRNRVTVWGEAGAPVE